MAFNLGSVFLNIGANLKPLRRDLNTAKGSVVSTMRSAAKAGAIALAGIGAGLTAGLASATSSAADFNAKMADVAALGVKDVGRLKEAVKDTSVAFGVDLLQNALATYDLISAGVDEKLIPATLRAANTAAKAGRGSLAEAVDLGTSIARAFNEPFSNMAEIFDAAIIAVNEGKTTIGEMGATVGRVAASASTAGVSMDEMFAVIAAGAGTAGNTAEVITGLKATLAGILKPTKQANEAAEALGIEFSGQALKAKGLQKFLQELGDAVAGDAVLMNQFFGSTEAANLVLALTANNGKLLSGTLETMAGKQGQANRAFEKWKDANPAFAFNQAKQAVEVLKVEIGEQLLPVLADIARDIKPLLEDLRDWIRENRETAGTIIKVTAVLAQLAVAIGTIRLALGLIIKLFGLFGGAATAAVGTAGAAGAGGVGLAGLAGAAAALAGPLALGALIVAAGASVLAIGAATLEAGKAIKAFFDWRGSIDQTKGALDRYIESLEKSGIAIDKSKLKGKNLNEQIQEVNKQRIAQRDRTGEATEAEQLFTKTTNQATGSLKKVTAASEDVTSAFEVTGDETVNVEEALRLAGFTAFDTSRRFYQIGDGARAASEAIREMIALLEELNEKQGGIPGNARGTENFEGGLTRINEEGGEIVNLPQGTQIIPHDLSKIALQTVGRAVQGLKSAVDGTKRALSQQAVRFSEARERAREPLSLNVGGMRIGNITLSGRTPTEQGEELFDRLRPIIVQDFADSLVRARGSVG